MNHFNSIILLVYVYEWAYINECHCSWKPEESDHFEGGVIGSGELPDMVAKTWFVRVYELLTIKSSLKPMCVIGIKVP